MRSRQLQKRLLALASALLVLALGCGESDSPGGSGSSTRSGEPTGSFDLFRLSTTSPSEPRVEAPRVEVAGQWRRARRVMPGQPLEWNLRLPPAARIGLGVAMHPDAWVLRGDGMVAKVEIDDGHGTHTVWNRWISPRDHPEDRTWLDADLDLSSWSGRKVKLRVVCEASPPRHTIFRPNPHPRSESLLLSRPLIYSAKPPTARDNVLLLVIDTLRADATHFGGNPRPLSPALDALAAESLYFPRAWSVAPWTHPSTASLLSGWTPWQHGLGQGPAGTTQLAADTPMVATDFQREGFATAAISGNSIVSPEEGFARGFDHFDTRAFENEQRGYGAQRITRAALEWVGHHDRQPFFLYLHYFDPHDRYQAPAPFTRAFVDSSLDASRLPSSIREGAPNPIQTALVEDQPGFQVRPQEIRYLRDLYDGEVAYVDHWVGVLLDGLRQRGLLEHTWVVFTSDHGEEFFEHGCVKHGQDLYQQLVAVPLLLRPPDRSGLAPRRIDTPVSLLDLAPTLRDVESLDRTDATLRRSWRPLWESSEPATRDPLLLANYSRVGGRWSGEQRGLVDWPWKWIRTQDPEAEFLFDLARDGGEKKNLAASQPQRCRDMERRCAELYGGPQPPSDTQVPVDPRRLEKLKALGYVH